MRRLALVLALGLAIGCEGVGRLDLTAGGRDRWQRPEDVVRALEIQPGDRVADLGAGDGYFVSHLSDAVGVAGVVYAVDVETEIVEKLGETFPPDSTNVKAILGEYGDPLLPDGSIDLVLIVNTYHHIEDRPAYFRRLRRDLEPDGRVAVIDPNEELGGILGLTLDEGHMSSAASVEEEMREAGYRVEARHEFLPVQIFRVFARDDAS